jgi:WD40 repeat protein
MFFLKLWNLRTGEQIKKTLKGHTSCVSALAVLPNGDLASGSWDTTIKVF